MNLALIKCVHSRRRAVLFQLAGGAPLAIAAVLLPSAACGQTTGSTAAVPSASPVPDAPVASAAAVQAKQEAASKPIEPGDIVVTANRRSQSLQDVGVAVAAFDPATLRAFGLSKSSDLAQLTPGVSVTGSVGGQSQQFTVRGVTQASFADGLESPVAVYVDDVYIPAQQGQSLALFDIERVEVLKGPQGTLFGRNATGGLVSTVVARPTIGSKKGFVDVTYARFGQAKVEGALDLPISDIAALRVSGYYDRVGDVWNNRYPAGMVTGAPLNFGTPAKTFAQDEGAARTFAGRLQLLLKPNDRLTVRLSGSGVDQQMSTGPYTSSAVIGTYDAQDRLVQVDRVGPDETRIAIGPGGSNYTNPAVIPFAQFAFPYNGTRAPGATWFGYKPLDPGSLDLSSDFARKKANTVSAVIGAAHVDYDLDGIQVASVTAYQRHKKNLLTDADGSPVNIFNFGAKATNEAFSEELRFSGGDRAFRWTGGLYYLDVKADAVGSLMGAKASAFAVAFGQGDTGIEFSPIMYLLTRSVSAFGQTETALANKLTLVVGGRVIREHQSVTETFNAYQNSDDYKIDTANALYAYLPPFSDKRTKVLWAAKAQLEYRPVSNLLVYAGWNRGVKAGSYNAPGLGTPLTPAQIPFGAETLNNYEGGVKYGDRWFSINTSAFYYDYAGYQAFVFSNAAGYITNTPMKVYGIDADMGIQITDELRATAGASYTHAQIDDFEIAPGVFRDVRPTAAPRAQLTGSLRYQIPAELAGGHLAVAAQANYSSGFYHNLRNFNADWFAGRTLVNLSANWTQEPSGFRAAVFVNNVLDERYGLIGFDNAPNCGCNDESFGAPLTWGVSVGFRF